jgi:hypothetical protein
MKGVRTCRLGEFNFCWVKSIDASTQTNYHKHHDLSHTNSREIQLNRSIPYDMIHTVQHIIQHQQTPTSTQH